MTSKKKENLTQTTEALAALGNRLIAVSEWNFAMVMHFDSIGVNEEESPDIEYASKNIEDLLKSLESQLRDVSEMRDKALGIDERLGIEAHALLSSVYRYYDRAADSARERIGKNDGFAVRMIAYAYQRSHEVSNPAVEVLGAKLVARSQFLEKNRFGVPLPPHGESVYQIILANQPILGKDIIEKLDDASPEGETKLVTGTLTKDVMPKVMELRGIKNQKGVGYYDPFSYDPKKDVHR